MAKSNPILTAKVGTNADLFPDILKLYVPKGSRVLDMTYGKGVFWKKVDKADWDLVRNDHDVTKGDVHEDFRKTSWPVASFDCVILDPPYIFGAGGRDSVMDEQYGNNEYRLAGSPGVGAIVSLYQEGMDEAYRLLRKDGLLIVKTMDLISSGKQHRVSIRLWHTAIDVFNMEDVDQFVLVTDRVVMRHDYQLHARKNHSYFLLFRK